jgi:glycosyltransferase involved in cell wall biosynthesis
MTALRLSVVTPAYNQAEVLANTIDSVLNQDVEIEHLVINDGSTDDTEAVLSSYGDRLTWRTQTNAGQTTTINRGWRELTGDVLTWLNSDDTFTPGAAAVALDYLAAHPDTDIVYGRTVFTDPGGRRLPGAPPGRPFDYLTFLRECENPIPQPSAFIRRRVLDDIGLLDERFYYFMDWDYWLRAGLGHRIDFIPEILSTYRLHDESKSVAGQLRAAPELEYMYDKFFARSDLPPEVRNVRAEAMANMRLAMGSYRLHGNDQPGARRDAVAAVRERPAMLVRPRSVRRLLYVLAGGTRGYSSLRSMRRRSPRPSVPAAE